MSMQSRAHYLGNPLHLHCVSGNKRDNWVHQGHPSSLIKQPSLPRSQSPLNFLFKMKKVTHCNSPINHIIAQIPPQIISKPDLGIKAILFLLFNRTPLEEKVFDFSILIFIPKPTQNLARILVITLTFDGLSLVKRRTSSTKKRWEKEESPLDN